MYATNIKLPILFVVGLKQLQERRFRETGNSVALVDLMREAIADLLRFHGIDPTGGVQ